MILCETILHITQIPCFIMIDSQIMSYTDYECIIGIKVASPTYILG